MRQELSKEHGMDKKPDTQSSIKAATQKVQSDAPKTELEIAQKLGGHIADPSAVDRPGFDIGGSSGDTTAGTGLGLGTNAGESRSDRSLPGRHAGATVSIPRWSGPTPREPRLSNKGKVSGPKNQ
jgi:hypothetical protein